MRKNKKGFHNLVTKIKNLTDLIITLCTKKYIFFYRKGSPPRMVEIHRKWAGLSNADSNHFGKLGCTHERICMEKNGKVKKLYGNVKDL